MADLCDGDGANRLATKIQEFWRKRGFDVDVGNERRGICCNHAVSANRFAQQYGQRHANPMRCGSWLAQIQRSRD